MIKKTMIKKTMIKKTMIKKLIQTLKRIHHFFKNHFIIRNTIITCFAFFGLHELFEFFSGEEDSEVFKVEESPQEDAATVPAKENKPVPKVSHDRGWNQIILWVFLLICLLLGIEYIEYFGFVDPVVDPDPYHHINILKDPFVLERTEKAMSSYRGDMNDLNAILKHRLDWLRADSGEAVEICKIHGEIYYDILEEKDNK